MVNHFSARASASSAPQRPSLISSALGPLAESKKDDLPSLDPSPTRFESHQIANPASENPPAINQQLAATALQKAQGPLVNAVDVSKSKETALKTIEERVRKIEKAKLQADVDIARKGFIKKLWGVASAGLVLAAAALASAASLGAATPFLAVACVHMALAIGDVGCALMTHRNALAAQQHATELPYPRVTLGGNCLSNLIHRLTSGLFKKPETARKFATWLAAGLRIGLMGAHLPMAFLSPVHLAATATAIKSVGAGIKLVLSGYTLTHLQTAETKASHVVKQLSQEGGGVNPQDAVVVIAMVLGRIRPGEEGQGLMEKLGSDAVGSLREDFNKTRKREGSFTFEKFFAVSTALGSTSQLAKLAQPELLLSVEILADQLAGLSETSIYEQTAEVFATWMKSLPPPQAWAEGLEALLTT